MKTLAGLAFLLAALAAGPASAAAPLVDLALVLAVDSSASVDSEEFAQQRGGLAAAFRDPEVVAAIAQGPLKRIAVSVMEWAGAKQQVLLIDWTLIRGSGDAQALADRIDGLDRAIPTGATSIAAALSYGGALLRTAPVDATRHVIDLSSDGRNNQGQNVEDVRRIILAQGITINALTILNEHPTLNYYFEDRVIGGPGAFVEIADDYRAYVEAIRRKLIREIRSLSVSQGPAITSPGTGARLAANSPPPR